MFIGSFVFRFIGILIKWILAGFKGGLLQFWQNRNPDKEFEEILIGFGMIVLMTIMFF